MSENDLAAQKNEKNAQKKTKKSNTRIYKKVLFD